MEYSPYLHTPKTKCDWSSTFAIPTLKFNTKLTHCGLGDFNEILDEYFSSQLQWLMAEIPAVKLPLEECH